MYAAYEIKWTEFNKGELSRPGGRSYHKTKEDADATVYEKFGKVTEEYVASMGDNMPDKYLQPDEPKLVEVTKKLYEKIKAEKIVWVKPVKNTSIN